MVLACLLILTGTSVAPSQQESGPGDSFRTLLVAPRADLRPSSEVPGSIRIRMEGFGVLQRPGAPAVPIRIERIGIPEGATPRLRVLRLKSRRIPSLRLEPVPAASGAEAAPGDETADLGAPRPRRAAFRPDAAVYGRDADYPSEAVSLGALGRLRDQRYVELIFTPLQVNPVTGVGRIAEEVEVEVSFPVDSGFPRRSAGRPGSDLRFEGVYRRGLLNYDQASSFRVVPEGTAGFTTALPQPESGGGGTVYKVRVRQDGIYRILCSDVPTCSVPALLGGNPNTFRLRNRGVEVPMRVVGGGDNSFDIGDVLEFYGQRVKEPFTLINCDSSISPACSIPIYQYNDVTDVQVYLLDETVSTARLRMATLDGTPGLLSAESTFLETAHWEVNDRFLPLNDNDPFYSIPTLAANSTNPASRDISVPLPGRASVAFTAPVKVRLRGVSSNDSFFPDHRTQVTVNGNAGTTTVLDWDGEIVQDQATVASQGILTDPTTVHVEVPVVSGLSLDQVGVDFVEISYRRLFQTVSDRLGFDFPNQDAKFAVSGFSGGPILVYDLSRTLAGTSGTLEPRLVVNGVPGGTILTFQVGAEGAPTGPGRRFLLLGPGGALAPDSVAPMPASTLLDPTNEADYIIIAHPSLVDLAPGSPYNQFVSYLQTSRGLKTRLVAIEEIYDAFNNSLSHPEAIRSFLAYAHDNWVGPSGTSPPASYLLLVGDAVWDFKNVLNRNDWIDLVPTPIMFYQQAILQYHAADNWLASFLGGDQSADILFGRIPARTLAQADTVFSKILGYAQSPPPGAWRSDAYLLADVGNDALQTQDFEDIENAAAARFQPPWTFTKQYYAEPPYSAPSGGCYPCAPATQYKSDFVSHWNTAHPVIGSFTGHGSFDILGNDFIFRPADVPLLTNGAYLPFFYNSDCLTGGFHAVGVDSIGESFLESPSGGAVAFLAPASLSFTFIGQTVSDRLFGDLFSIQKIRELGILAANARSALYQQGSFVDMQGYALLGDPSLNLVMPAPKPPTGFAVAAGNGRVDLAWTASNDPAAVGTDIYRTPFLTQPYTKVNSSPVSGTLYADLSVTNGTTYFYRAVAVDAGGFEGAVTNTNEDCGADPTTDGPQCRRATPKNLVPPVAVQGVQAKDTGTGTSLDISWLANPEADIARYRIRFGASPGSHPTLKDAGLATSATLFGLTTGTTYYIVVSAVNTSGIEGAASGEAAATPHLFLGIAPPRTIQDLMISRSGGDLVLTWGAVTTNIIGGPTTVDHYSVYRGNSPAFVPNSTNRIAIVPDSPSPSFVHSGGAILPDDGFYLVSAVDLEGFASGLGGDLPAGILALTVEPSPTAGMLRISWPAVTTTVTGAPANIHHYTLYGSPSVLPRRLIGPGNLLLDNLSGPFIDVTVPPDSRYFYNVVTVDTRGNFSPY